MIKTKPNVKNFSVVAKIDLPNKKWQSKSIRKITWGISVMFIMPFIKLLFLRKNPMANNKGV